MTLSVVIITYNEEQNIGRTLASVAPLMRELGGEIIVVDAGSTDRTREIAESFGAKVFVEGWKGFAAQKNSAIEKAAGDWILNLDADEEVSSELSSEIAQQLASTRLIEPRTTVIDAARRAATWKLGDPPEAEHARGRDAIAFQAFGPVEAGFYVSRTNLFLGRWIKHGGFWPDCKLRLFRRGRGHVGERAVHENIQLQGDGNIGKLNGPITHHAYPTLSSYIEHMNRYSSLGAGRAASAFSISSCGRWPRSSITTSFAWDFSTAARGCYYTCITLSM